MMYQYRNVRQAMTAIAAVLAFSSTPVLAQRASGQQAVAQQSTQQAPSGSAPANAPATAPMVDPGPMPVADPDPAQAKAPQSGFAELDPEQAAPFAGAAALGLLIWGAAAMIGRRKRRKQMLADQAAKREFIEQTAATHPEALEEQVVQVPRHDPVPAKALADAPTTDLPEGFDVSRFGPHVQAAYRGPTPDNPSLSLKHRLRRASFFDQQKRRVGAQAPANAPGPQPATVPARSADELVHAGIPAKGNWESRPDARFIFNRAGSNKQRVEQH